MMVAENPTPITTTTRTTTSFMDAGCATEHRFTLKLTHPPHINPKHNEKDEEIGIFGAEKYFTGAIDDNLLRTSHCRKNTKHKMSSPKPETRSTTPSVRSESSWNSRKGLLVSSGSGSGHGGVSGNGNDNRKRNSVKSLLASLGCNCNDKGSVTIVDNRAHVKEGVAVNGLVKDLGPKTKVVSRRWADEKTEVKREECFTFPVLNSLVADGKHPRLPEVVGASGLEKGKKSFSLERKLTMLNWDGVTPRAEVMDVARNGHNDTGSDASSDLFELESFSTHENNSFLAKPAVETTDRKLSNGNGYAPSEASVDWSVITASAADFSTVEDSTDSRRVTDKVSGILSGCKSLKAVRVSGDEKTAAVTVGPTMREWRRRSDTVAPIAKIQGDAKRVGSESYRVQKVFGNRMHTVPASHHLYIQQ